MISADGPMPDHLANGTRRSTGTEPSGGPRLTTQPPTRRPCNGTRTIDPTATRARRRFGHEIVELLVETGDIGYDPGDEQRRRVHCPATLEDYRPTALL